MVPHGFPRVQDTFLSSSIWPEVYPITKYRGMESPSSIWVQLGIQEQTTLKLMPMLHMTSNVGILGLWKGKELIFSMGLVSYLTKI
jgi:hypothetical protein